MYSARTEQKITTETRSPRELYELTHDASIYEIIHIFELRS